MSLADNHANLWRATDSFISQPIAKEDLEQILKAGLEAPSSYNPSALAFRRGS